MLKRLYDKKSQKEEKEPVLFEDNVSCQRRSHQRRRSRMTILDSSMTKSQWSRSWRRIPSTTNSRILSFEQCTRYGTVDRQLLRILPSRPCVDEGWRFVELDRCDESRMKILSIDDFISVFQLIDVDDVDVVFCLSCYSRFAKRCIPCGTTIRMAMSVSGTLFTHLRMPNVQLCILHSKRKGSENDRMDYIFRTADSTRDSMVIRLFIPRSPDL